MKLIRRQFTAISETLGPRQIQVIAATDELARDNAIVVPAGIDLTNYRLNPVVLAFHDNREPIGTASNVAVIAGKLRATIEFAAEGISPTADRVCALCKSSVLLEIYAPPSPGMTPVGINRPSVKIVVLSGLYVRISLYSSFSISNSLSPWLVVPM